MVIFRILIYANLVSLTIKLYSVVFKIFKSYLLFQLFKNVLIVFIQVNP